MDDVSTNIYRSKLIPGTLASTGLKKVGYVASMRY